MNRTLIPAIIVLAVTFLIFENSNLDLTLQDNFYHFDTGTWLVTKEMRIPHLVFYSGIKALITALGIGLIILCLLPVRFFERLTGGQLRRVDLWVVVATLITAPSLIALGKATTNVHCPYELTRYNGEQSYLKVLENPAPGTRPARRGRGFPAGHASGGFALLSLASLGRTRRQVAAGISIGLLAGSSMGIYQMLRGAHFLSHTLVTALTCWIVFLLWRQVLSRRVPTVTKP